MSVTDDSKAYNNGYMAGYEAGYQEAIRQVRSTLHEKLDHYADIGSPYASRSHQENGLGQLPFPNASQPQDRRGSRPVSYKSDYWLAGVSFENPEKDT